MFLPGQRIMHPEFGDVTEDVIAELLALRGGPEQIVEDAMQEQIRIAAATRDAKTLKFGHAVGAISPALYDAMERREGRGFWTDRTERNRFFKHHPECKVTAKSRKTVVNGISSLRGGRWAA
jgi:hypothetical protein